MRTDTGQVFRLEDYKPTDFLIPETRLEFVLHPERTIVKSVLTVERREGAAADAPLILDGDELALTELKIDGTPAGDNSYVATPDRLEISGLPASGSFTLEIVTEINPTTNRQLSGLYRSSDVYCTQCEAEGFRRITYFLDRPDLLSVYTVRIEADRSEAPLLLSNGNPQESGDLGNGRHFALWHDPHPKPTYLFALVAGDLGVVKDRFTTASGRPVDLGIYVEHGKEGRALYAMDALQRSMRWDEEKFGREYDLDVFNVVAVSDFNMGAMENKGLNVFNDKYVLADPDTATDADYAGIEAVIAHEYFHNWTGNRITCRDWFQLCLKEGLTVYRDHEFSADMRSRPVKRIAEVKGLKAHQFPEDAGPLAHPVRPRQFREINNFYTSTVYEKGSEVVRMIHTILGAELFRKGMDLYFERHDGDAATIEDFIKVFEDVSGEDLGQFALWYDQAGTPNLAVTYDYDAASKVFEIEIEQSQKPTPGQPSKKPMHIPVQFGLLGAKGRELKPASVKGGTVKGDVIHLRKRKERFSFSGIGERPVPSLLRQFSAPVTMTSELTRSDLVFLARHDTDEVTRWQALTQLLTAKLTSNSKRIRGGKPATIETSSLRLLGELATNDRLDMAFRALCLALPSESDIAREIGNNIDPDAVLASRDAMIAAVGDAHADKLAALYSDLGYDGPFSPDAQNAGRRALRNVILDYLSVAEKDPGRAKRQFGSADNMTDRAAALSVLVQRFGESSAAEEALVVFEKRFGDDALVMDKWFMIQAMRPGAAALDHVRALMKHRLFSLDNPNRTRALVGAFSSGNQTGFNRVDGEGYRFFAQTILQIDGRNGQLAARLLTAMRSWRSFEPIRREHAREALASIATVGALSADVRDIVERTLA
ncbi:aminopeptidase N [Phyllobacterium sp. 0TCS1.6C]|uniref:aminopeptidase N n=1 Tax=unclassified Phyllobacterium TaxID=2638441 RepID=UPI002264938E|nr:MULTISPECIES: aminopeptidase N [unclassified Phyllobacterium]MCX8280609.1 aminopeptidase N [Phyllobacterium sp. 0TCS1.6C]MCX8296454.1 aminopeptidase N [Phyllobacterium sp. 0TCS1.6A]